MRGVVRGAFAALTVALVTGCAPESPSPAEAPSAEAPAPPIGGAPLPDLAVRRDGLTLGADSVRVVVENRGEAPSPATEVELWDRPPLLGPTGTSCPYTPVQGRSGVWISQEPAGPETVAFTLTFERAAEPERSVGSLQTRAGHPLWLAEPCPFVTLAPDSLGATWSVDVPATGFVIPFRIAARSGEPPVVRLELTPREDGRVHTIKTFENATASGLQILTLDCLDRVPARRRRLSCPPLEPGGCSTLTTVFPGGARGEVFAWVDPDESLPEIREGNNCASLRRDHDGWSQGALHIHSSFSEGGGSVDWQARMAVLSGYDLLWWSEHDWRISCWEHLTEIGFEEGEWTRTTFTLSDETCVADVTDEPVATGERALRLHVPAGDAGWAVAAIGAERRRLAYSLASKVELALAVFVRNLDADDVLSIRVTLSRHPGVERQLLYRLCREGADVAAGAGAEDVGAGVAVIRRSVPTGGWVRLRLPLSADAARSWRNGLDNNVMGLRVELASAGSGADVSVDDLEITHEICGDGLRRLQEEWSREYPNVAHQFGEEVSYLRPHLNQYGGQRGTFDYAAEWEALYVETVVDRVHEQGGVVSWCHPFGTRLSQNAKLLWRPAYRDSILNANLGDTDILEVGYRNRAYRRLPDYLAFWDAAGARGLAITGIGVNDSHEFEWARWENNFATWVAAPATDEPALLRALAAGRGFFGDPLGYRGRLTLATGSARVGDVVVGAGTREVTVVATDLPSGAVVRLIVDGAVHRTWTDVTGMLEAGIELSPGSARVVRAEIWDGEDRPLAFTNPVYFDADGSARARR